MSCHFTTVQLSSMHQGVNTFVSRKGDQQLWQCSARKTSDPYDEVCWRAERLELCVCVREGGGDKKVSTWRFEEGGLKVPRWYERILTYWKESPVVKPPERAALPRHCTDSSRHCHCSLPAHSRLAQPQNHTTPGGKTHTSLMSFTSRNKLTQTPHQRWHAIMTK